MGLCTCHASISKGLRRGGGGVVRYINHSLSFYLTTYAFSWVLPWQYISDIIANILKWPHFSKLFRKYDFWKLSCCVPCINTTIHIFLAWFGIGCTELFIASYVPEYKGSSQGKIYAEPLKFFMSNWSLNQVLVSTEIEYKFLTLENSMRKYEEYMFDIGWLGIQRGTIMPETCSKK